NNEQETKNNNTNNGPITSMTVINKLWDAVETKSHDSSTKLWVMSATAKLCCHLNPIPEEVTTIIMKYQKSVNSDLQQMSHELLEMIKEKDMMIAVYKDSAITDDINVDTNLT